MDVNAPMRAAIDAFDWSRSPLGPMDEWPQPLRAVLSLVLDSPFPMLIMWGPQLVQLYNQGYVPIFGDKHPRSLGESAATSWSDIWSDVGPLLRGVYENGEAVFFENLPLQMERNGGYEEAYFTFSYSPIRDGGTVAGVMCIASETTAHVVRERETAERADILAKLDRAKTEFFSNVSHEFRTPLTLMLGPLEDLVRTLPEYEQRQSAELARRNAVRLEKLVDMLLDFAAAQSGVAQPNPVEVDIDSLTTDLVSEFRAAYEHAGLSLSTECHAGRTIVIDRMMYEKLLLNMLSNALKFTFNGGVRVETKIEASDFVLRVSDTGIGIERENAARLFERFSRVHGARSRTHEGTGIGLALVKELVELQGGTIAVESEPGRGSTFNVRFPATRASGGSVAPLDTGRLRRAYREEAEMMTSSRRDHADVLGPSKDAPVVVVADDNADLRAYLMRVLSSKYRVRACADGSELIRLAETLVPDLIIADIMMPNLDGFEALRRIRASKRTAQIPFMMLSARAGKEASADGLLRGADEYVVKPFVAADVLARADALLRRSRTTRTNTVAERGYGELSSHLADRFISAVSVEAVFDAITQTLTPEFADWSSVSTVGENGRIEARSVKHVEAAKTELGVLLSREYPAYVADGSPVALALTRGETFSLFSVTAEQIREGASDARHAAILQTLELRSVIIVPIMVSGNPVGAITVVRSEGSPAFTAADVSFLERIASRASLAYASARTQERERTIATTLQRALLPSALPPVTGLRFSASYTPASQESMVGGDWYDAFSVTRDRVIVSIGDVVGHGIDAATVMATLRQSVRSLALEHREPADILTYLNRLLFAERSGRLATAYVAVIDPQTLEAHVASAGHASALRIDAAGRASTLAAEGLLLGVDETAQYVSQQYRLEAGDLVALYTDGYIEESRDLAAGEARFIEAVTRARDAADPATAVHLELFGVAPPSDDAALLTIAVEPVLEYLDVRLPARPEMAALARTALRRFVASTQLSEERRSDLVLAAGEATINAIEHAFAGREPGSIRIAAQVEGTAVVVAVSDDGLGWNTRGDSESQRGYGLPLMHALTDGVEIERSATGTTVRLTTRAPQPAELAY